MPIAAYGVSAEVAAPVIASTFWHEADVGGIGGTLAGNALSLAAARATLGEVLTDAAFETREPLAIRLAEGVRSVIAEMPQHGADVACHHRGSGRPAHQRVRRDRERSPALRQAVPPSRSLGAAGSASGASASGVGASGVSASGFSVSGVSASGFTAAGGPARQS